MVVDAVVGVTEEDSPGGRPAASHRRAGAGGGQQGRRHQPRAGGVGVRGRSASAIPIPVSALHGRGTGDLLDALCAALPYVDLDDASQIDDEAAEVASSAAPGRQGLLGGAGRPTQRRQVDAVQPPHRRGPLGGARPARHHPRLDRHGGRDRRRAGALRRHRRHAAQGPHRRGHRVLLVRPGPAVDRHGRRGPAGHRRHRRRHPPGPAPGRAHRRGRLPGRRAAQQVGDARRRGAHRGHLPGRPEAALPRRRRRCSRSARSPARACSRCCRRWPTRSTTTTSGCRPGRSTR